MHRPRIYSMGDTLVSASSTRTARNGKHPSYPKLRNPCVRRHLLVRFDSISKVVAPACRTEQSETEPRVGILVKNVNNVIGAFTMPVRTPSPFAVAVGTGITSLICDDADHQNRPDASAQLRRDDCGRSTGSRRQAMATWLVTRRPRGEGCDSPKSQGNWACSNLTVHPARDCLEGIRTIFPSSMVQRRGQGVFEGDTMNLEVGLVQ